MFGCKYKGVIDSSISSHRGISDVMAAPDFTAALQLIRDSVADETGAPSAPTASALKAPVVLIGDEDGEDAKQVDDNLGMIVVIKRLPTVPVDKLRPFAQKAEKIVNRNLSIISPSATGSISGMISEHPIGKSTGDDAAPMLIHYDHKLSGEASSKPASRIPPHCEEDMKALISAVLASRPDPTTIAEGDQYVWMDGGKPGLAHSFDGVFKAGRTAMQKHKRTLTILYSYESIMQKRERENDYTDMNLLETAHMISKYPLKLPVIERAGTLTGNNATNGVGPLPICCTHLAMVVSATRAS